MKSRQQGFTLVELVVVIVILGILSATALPRFINVTQQARQASLDGLVGAIASAVSLCQASYTAAGTTGAGTCAMNGATPAVAAGGLLTAVAGGAGAPLALGTVTGFGAAVCDGTICTWNLTGPTAGTCTVVYTAAAGTAARGATAC